MSISHITYKPLRDMLRYQLPGVNYAFRQLKFLNSVVSQPTYSSVIY